MAKLSTKYTLAIKSEKGLLKANQVLEEHLQSALNELKKGNKSVPFLQSKDVVHELKDHVGTSGYRDWKFVHSETQVQTFLGECYDALVQKMPNIDNPNHGDYVSKKDFIRIYEPVAVTKLNSRRQFSQTQMLEAVKSEW